MTAFADQLWEDAGAPLIQEMFGVSVTYMQSGASVGSFTATYDVVDYTLIDNEGLTSVIYMRDYTITVASLGAVTPRAGDVVVETINGVQRYFEVRKLAQKPAAEMLPGGFRWLVHTQEVHS